MGAFSKWGNRTYLADALGRNNGNHIRIKKQLKKSIFTLMNPNLKLKFYPEPQQKYQLLNVSVKSFLNKIFDSTENGEEGISYQYFAGELPPTLLKDVNNDFKVKQVEKQIRTPCYGLDRKVCKRKFIMIYRNEFSSYKCNKNKKKVII